MGDKKWCPVCNSEEWDYDVFDSLFTYCRGCHELVQIELSKYEKNTDGLHTVSNVLRAVAETREAKLG